MGQLIIIAWTSNGTGVTCPKFSCKRTHTITPNMIGAVVECCFCGTEFRIRQKERNVMNPTMRRRG